MTKSNIMPEIKKAPTHNIRGCYTYTGGRGRTGTPVRALDFESSASANSATPACFKGVYRTYGYAGKQVLSNYTIYYSQAQENNNWGSWIRTNA